jgi:hypothetical protein
VCPRIIFLSSCSFSTGGGEKFLSCVILLSAVPHARSVMFRLFVPLGWEVTTFRLAYKIEQFQSVLICTNVRYLLKTFFFQISVAPLTRLTVFLTVVRFTQIVSPVRSERLQTDFVFLVMSRWQRNCQPLLCLYHGEEVSTARFNPPLIWHCMEEMLSLFSFLHKICTVSHRRYDWQTRFRLDPALKVWPTLHLSDLHCPTTRCNAVA